jgi:hypothetical protein
MHNVAIKNHVEPGGVAYACNSSTREVEAGESQDPLCPGLHSEVEASLGNIARPCLKKEKKPENHC